MDPTLYERDTCDLIGRLLFGRPARLRLGMWIASLPGRPHTFTQKQFWEFCERAQWPECGKSVLADLRRFHQLEMIEPRPDLAAGRRVRYWTKQTSPLWRIFQGAIEGIRFGGIVYSPEYVPSTQRMRRAQQDLMNLVRDLHG